MKVTCIIPTYEKFDYIEETLESVMMQTFPDIEIIITDDASSNFNERAIRRYIENRRQKNITHFQILKHERNVGTVKNMNLAVKASRGDIIIPLASDDKFASENVISLIVKRFKETSCKVLVCSRLKCSQDMAKKYRLMPHPGYIGYIKKYINTASSQFEHIALGMAMEFASGSSMYYTKAFFERVGGYDEKYVLWEDGPFIAKVTREGYRIEMAYDIVAILYRDGGISSKTSKGITQSKIRLDYINAIKYEYLAYPDRFTEKQVKVLIDKYQLLKEYGRESIRYIFKHPRAVLSIFKVKIKKFMYRYLCNKSGGNNVAKNFSSFI